MVDSGASGLYFAKDSPVSNVDRSAPQIRVGTASGQIQHSSARATLTMPQLPEYFPKTGHVMPEFKHSLMGLGSICDANCTVLFSKAAVTIFDPQGKPLLQGWRDRHGAKLWRFALRPTTAPQAHSSSVATEQAYVAMAAPSIEASNLHAFSAYDLPSVEALVRYLHAAAGFPVKSTWLDAIKAGNFASWPGLTYRNASKYCPSSDETIQGHMAQTRQNVRSTKPKPPKIKTNDPPACPQVVHGPLPSPAAQQDQKIPLPGPIRPTVPPPAPAPVESTNEVHIRVEPVHKLYTDDTGRFPVRARSGNQYIMIAYHVDSNSILHVPFKTKADKHRIEAYTSIRQRLSALGHKVDLQILDNEASGEYKRVITEVWKSRYQLVPPDMHRRNAAERAIRTFKAHFLTILAGVAPNFPTYLWDKLLQQAELTLNLLGISAWPSF